MGALAAGFDAAHQRRDQQVAEVHRKEAVADQELTDLSNLMKQDADFLRNNDITYDIAHRTLRLAHKRTPVLTVHYNVESQEYAMTVMHDGSHASPKTPEECAKEIGEILFTVLSTKSEMESQK